MKTEKEKYDSMTLEGIQDYLDNNKISSRSEFKKVNSYLYYLCIKRDQIDDLVFTSGQKSWKRIKTVSDAQEFIDKNNIISSHRLRDYGGLYSKCHRNGWIDKLNFRERSRKVYSWTNLSTVEDVQEFIDRNNIQSEYELSKTFPGLLDRISSLGGILNNLVFCRRKESIGEKFVRRYIKENLSNDEDYFDLLTISKRFTDIEGRNANYVYPDFLFTYDGSIYWIEYNGEQHYHKKYFYNSAERFEAQIKRDQSVRNYCKENPYDLPIYYIEVPYTVDTYKKVSDFLNKVILENTDQEILIDYKSLYE